MFTTWNDAAALVDPQAWLWMDYVSVSCNDGSRYSSLCGLLFSIRCSGRRRCMIRHDSGMQHAPGCLSLDIVSVYEDIAVYSFKQLPSHPCPPSDACRGSFRQEAGEPFNRIVAPALRHRTAQARSVTNANCPWRRSAARDVE